MFDVKNVRTISDERLIKIIEECFGTIKKKYDAFNFIRWINEKKIDAKIKTLDFEYTNEKEYPYAGGFHTTRKSGDLIAVQEKYDDNSTRNVIIHEFNHFLTADNFMNDMSGFINEGITEYLKNSVYDGGYKSYEYNVDLVVFLHDILGDILIKSYFTGATSKVRTRIDDLLGDGNSVESVIKQLSDIYKKCYNISLDEKKIILEKEENCKFFSKLYMDLYFGKVKEDSENMCYYSNGNIDINKIKDMIQIERYFPSYVIAYMNKDKKKNENESDLIKNYKKSLIRVSLENSHLIGYDDSSKIIEQYVNDIYSNKEVSIDNSTAMQILLLKKIGKEKRNIEEYANIILKVVSCFPSFFIDDLNKMPLLKLTLGDDFEKICNYVKCNYARYKNIDSFIEDHQKNTIESYYREIFLNLFLEKKDNKLYLIEFNSAGEIVKEQPIDSLSRKKNIVRTNIYCCDDNNNICQLQIVLDDDFSKIRIIPDINTKNAKIFTQEEFASYIKLMPLFKDTISLLRECKIIKNDSHEPFFGLKGISYIYNNADISADDYRTIKLDVKKFKEIIDGIFAFFPNEKLKDKIIDMISNSLKNIYYLDDCKEVSWSAETIYKILYENGDQSSIHDVEELLNTRKNERNDFIASKSELFFPDKKTEEEYYARKNDEEIKIKKENDKKELINKKNLIENIEKKLKMTQYVLYKRKPQFTNKTYYFDLPVWKLASSSHRREPGNVEIDINNLIEEMKNYVNLCKDIQDPLPFVIDKVDYTVKDLLEFEINNDEEKNFYNYFYNTIYNAIFNNVEINMFEYENKIKEVNNYIGQKEDYHSVIQSDENFERMFSIMSDLYEKMDNKEDFANLVQKVRNYILKHGYNDEICEIIESSMTSKKV